MIRRFTVVGIGELLWDLFPEGARFGGAPVNFACHAAALGASVHVVTGVGNDELGRQAVEALQSHGVNPDAVAICERAPTGTVHVAVDVAGKAAFTFAPDVAWDHLQWSERFARLAAACDAVCFGTLGQRSAESRETIQRFVGATPAASLRVFDINLRPPFFSEEAIRESLALASVLKLNDDELPILAAMCGATGSEVEVLAQLARQFDLQLVALTRGPRGAILMRGGEISEARGVPVAVKDTVGAGDAFTAALVLGLLRSDPLDEINHRACAVAAYVCSQAGATPPLPEALRREFQAQPGSAHSA
jgi:fructokinase